MTTIKHALPLLNEYPTLTHELILKHWTWFRKHLIAFYGMQNLPEQFGRYDGEVSSHNAVDEDDPCYDLAAPEYNHDWHIQKLILEDGTKKITIQVVNDLFVYQKNFYQFQYECPQLESNIIFHVSTKEQYLEFQPTASNKDQWILAADELDLFSRKKLAISDKIEHFLFLKHWSWFRQHLILFYNLQDLPQTFSSSEAGIPKEEAIEEGSALYDTTPLDYDDDSRRRLFIFEKDKHQVKVTFANGSYPFYRFVYKNATAPMTNMMFMVEKDTPYLEQYKASEYRDKWIEACRLIEE